MPVMAAAIEYEAEHGTPPGANGEQIASMSGLSVEDVGRALSRFDGEYLGVRKSMGPGPGADQIYRDARRAVGQWPSDDSWGD